MNPFPPQAYTRETMVKAYQWLQSQNPHIRELASTPDLLVSLYLKAQMQGNEVLDRPGIQNFKTELKSLAGMMGEFETGPAAEAITEAALTKMSASETIRPSNSVQMPPAAAQANPAGTYTRPPQPQHQSTAHQSTANERPERHHGKMELDARSLQMIHEVKAQLNLSSDMEALRAMISVGYTKFKRFSEHS